MSNQQNDQIQEALKEQLEEIKAKNAPEIQKANEHFKKLEDIIECQRQRIQKLEHVLFEICNETLKKYENYLKESK